MFPCFSREYRAQEAVVQIPDGGGDCQPVEEAEVARRDEHQLEDDHMMVSRSVVAEASEVASVLTAKTENVMFVKKAGK